MHSENYLDFHQNFCKSKVLQGVFISRHVTTSHVTYSSYPLWKKWWKGLIKSTQQNWHGVISSFVLVEWWLTLDASCSLRVRIPRWKSLASRVSERERAIVSIELCGSCLAGCIVLLHCCLPRGKVARSGSLFHCIQTMLFPPKNPKVLVWKHKRWGDLNLLDFPQFTGNCCVERIERSHWPVQDLGHSQRARDGWQKTAGWPTHDHSKIGWFSFSQNDKGVRNTDLLLWLGMIFHNCVIDTFLAPPKCYLRLLCKQYVRI